MEDFLQGLRQPEYLHAVLNHWPIFGMLAGLLTLLMAFFQKSRTTAIAAYVVILLASGSVWFVTEWGEKSEDRVEGLIDDPGRAWLHEHEDRADRWVPLFYATGALALAGLTMPGKFPKTSLPLLIMTFLAGGGALLAGTWIAAAGGKIMHREFRYSQPPPMKDIPADHE